MAATTTGTLMHLYRAILRVHHQKLPPVMREMGDKYAKTEFLAHINGKTSASQWDRFTAEWIQYHQKLGGQGADQPEADVVADMSPEQQSKMAKLYDEAQDLRKKMIDDIFPDPPK